jgi:hypothetical protein
MKPFLISSIFCICLVFSVQAQDKTYTPNARQAIKKSRMQQSEYLVLTKDSLEDKHQVSDSRPVNYQLERPVAIDIDAPKRRGKTSTKSGFVKLAANNSKRR